MPPRKWTLGKGLLVGVGRLLFKLLKRRWRLIVATVAVLSLLIYVFAPALVIRFAPALAIPYCANDLTVDHGCSSSFFNFNSGDETMFLIRMGKRSLPSLRRQLARTDLSTRTRIHLAWICVQIGDSAQFSEFLGGLKSPQPHDRYMAVVRMRDFPQLCTANIDTIVDAASMPQHDEYWWLLGERWAATWRSDPMAKMSFKNLFPSASDESGLSESDMARLKQMLH